MTHTARCAESASTRCKCDCGGSLHGMAPGPVYRALFDARATETRANPAVLVGVDEVVIAVLDELVRRAPGDMNRLEAIVEDVLAGEAWILLLDSKPPKRKLNRRHWLCAILADVATALAELTDIPGMIGQTVYDGCVDQGWGKLRSKAAAEMTERLAALALSPALDPVSSLPMQIRILAMMFCPAPDKHPALEGPFARDVYDSLEAGEPA